MLKGVIEKVNEDKKNYMNYYKNKMGEIPFPATLFVIYEVQKQQNTYWVSVLLFFSDPSGTRTLDLLIKSQ